MKPTPKRGRPTHGKVRASKLITIRATPETVRRLKALAKSQGRSVAQLLLEDHREN